tara:strand:- start:92 stop:754 length:663 start_codon:yes stop_codon:yes gene_type:complete
VKKIINGVMYDTDNAVKISTWDNYDPEDLERIKETLYLTHKLYPSWIEKRKSRTFDYKSYKKFRQDSEKKKIWRTNRLNIEHKAEYGNLFIHAEGGVLTEYSKLGLNEDGECDRVAGEKIILVRWTEGYHRSNEKGYGKNLLMTWLEKLDGNDVEKALVRLGYRKHGQKNRAGYRKVWAFTDPKTGMIVEDNESRISIAGGASYTSYEYGNAPKFKVEIA